MIRRMALSAAAAHLLAGCEPVPSENDEVPQQTEGVGPLLIKCSTVPGAGIVFGSRYSTDEDFIDAHALTLRHRNQLIDAVRERGGIDVFDHEPVVVPLNKEARLEFGGEELTGTFVRGEEPGYTVILKNLRFGGHEFERIDLYDGQCLLVGNQDGSAWHVLYFRLLDATGDPFRAIPSDDL